MSMNGNIWQRERESNKTIRWRRATTKINEFLVVLQHFQIQLITLQVERNDSKYIGIEYFMLY